MIDLTLIRVVVGRNLTPPVGQNSDIRQNLDRGISDFRTSRQSLVKENFHNSRTSDDADIKLGSVTKLDMRNETSKKIDSDVMFVSCDIIVIFAIYRFLTHFSNVLHIFL